MWTDDDLSEFKYVATTYGYLIHCLTYLKWLTVIRWYGKENNGSVPEMHLRRAPLVAVCESGMVNGSGRLRNMAEPCLNCLFCVYSALPSRSKYGDIQWWNTAVGADPHDSLRYRFWEHLSSGSETNIRSSYLLLCFLAPSSLALSFSTKIT